MVGRSQQNEKEGKKLGVLGWHFCRGFLGRQRISLLSPETESAGEGLTLKWAGLADLSRHGGQPLA